MASQQDPKLPAGLAKLAALMEDPLKGRFHMDVPTLNLIGEVALGDRCGIFVRDRLGPTRWHLAPLEFNGRRPQIGNPVDGASVMKLIPLP